MWLADLIFTQVGFIDPSGAITKFRLADSVEALNLVRPLSITEAPDGNAWFTFYITDNSGSPLSRSGIGRVTPSGTVTMFLDFPVRATESPNVTRLEVSEGQLVISRRDIRRRGSVATLPLAQLTMNFILLVTLFSANRQPLGGSNLARFLIAAGVLFVIHVVAVAVNVIAVYAFHLGEWSRQHYTPVQQDFWSIAAHFYGMIGVFAIPLVLWWILLPSQAPAVPPRRRR